MERRIVKAVPIQSIVVDKDLYPRQNVYWGQYYKYAEEIKSGAKFPLICLAFLNKKYVLVDGRHRIEALKILKKESIEAEIYTGWNEKKIFEESIRRNIAHGLNLSPFEKRSIALKLKQWKYPLSKISSIIQVPMDKVDSFIAQRLINSLTGETIKEVIIKSGIKHLAGQSFDNKELANIQDTQSELHSRTQIQVLDELIDILEGGLINVDNEKIIEKLEILYKLIGKIIK